MSAKNRKYEDNSANMPFRVLQFVEQNRRLFKAMLGKSDRGAHYNPLHDYLFVVTREHFRSMIQPKFDNVPQVEVTAHYYTSAFIGALAWWLENDIAYSAEAFSQIINRLTLPGLKEVFGD